MRRLVRALVLLSVFAPPLVLHAACSDADQAADGQGAGGESPTGQGSGTAGGSLEDGGDLDVSATQDGGSTPSNPYADLCGIQDDDDGATPVHCTPGAPGGDGCIGPTGGGGANQDQNPSCKLVPGERTAEPACLLPGTGVEAAPCQTAADCGPGLGCVLGETQTAGGTCRYYCCDNPNACAYASYCKPQPMAEAPGFFIPVCAAATMCTLLNDATCPEGLTCAIVKDDGTTSCVPPGDGKTGAPCPCAPGYTCIKALDQCKKICKLENQNADCEKGMCIGGSGEFPEGYGICTQ